MQYQTDIRTARTRRIQLAVNATLSVVILLLTAWSAVVVKRATLSTPLARTAPLVARTEPAARPTDTPLFYAHDNDGAAPDEAANEATIESELDRAAESSPSRTVVPDGAIRWFDGRPVRPARTIWMRVTAYSPDARSCGRWADGQTASLHSVWTNGMRLVAADTRLLPFGSMLTIPGYADNEIVPVLDRGGAIKGRRLDVLAPTHAIARKWGVRDIPVTVWEYADE